ALAQKFAQEGFKVILADRDLSFVDKGLNNIKSMLNEGIDRKVFSTEQVEGFLLNLKGTQDLNDLKVCDLVVEAIFENFDAKVDLFKNLSTIVSTDCIIATNTSSFSITELSVSITYPERFIGLHFFYHAAKNRLVEIIRSEKTSDATYEAIKRFSILAGKDAITCEDAYGFAVNRFFVPWLNEAVHLLEEEIATPEIIDQVCMKVFKIGMGPFALMNATGVPVAYHAEKTLEIFGNLYTVAPALEQQTKLGKHWEINNSGIIDINLSTEKIIRDRMFGVVFFVCSQLLDEKVCSATDLNRGARIGLQWKKGPVELMEELGEEEVKRLVALMANKYQMDLPKSIGKSFWETKNVKVEKSGTIAIITMDQPENLNALSEATMNQLAECFDSADKDNSIETIFITGSGKAFVAGADIKFFVKNIKKDRICDIETFTAFGQSVFERIDNSKKKVVAIVNGLSLGGGLELALCADVILALPKVQLAFPETSIGIYPGLGGTQRSAKKIGKGLSKYLIHTGKMLSGKDAFDIGLVDKLISYDEMFAIMSGEMNIPANNNISLNEKWKTINDFFENNTLNKILSSSYTNHSISKEEAEKIVKTISFKAPIALKLADMLIDEAKGCKSELDHLNEIFSTSDTLLGLTSIGKKVEYSGK
ncbi:MAG: 3-hydroxyacyl-CoA dehydrogenase/enoyl-CoA hydratase family protein, partial [Bacteroidetes bacterium]|nr:3-hydroxyacyl-CoA dehydrogenase/enoyl-CoA hydratase family protein [Bacteroidota bacterium]